MFHSRWMLALLVVLMLGAWLGLGRIQRGERPAAAGRERLESAAPSLPSSSMTVPSPASPAVRVALGDTARAGSPPAAAEDAHLTLRVVARETGAVLPELAVWLRLPRTSGNSSGEESRGRAGEALKTDAHGRVEYHVASGWDYRLEVAGGGELRAIGFAQDIAAFAPGERRELVVRLDTALDLVWFGRVLDGQTYAPIAGANVERVTDSPFAESREPAATSDAGGVVRFLSASSRASYARAEYPGYTSGYVWIRSGHEEPSAAWTVLLFRPATLEVLVRDTLGAPRPGLTARLTSRTDERVQGVAGNLGWASEHPRKGLTDPAGRCVLAGLPARVALTLEILDGFQLLRREEHPLRLEPGEQRVLACTVGSGCTVRGFALAADGRPASNVVVWLAPDDGSGSMDSACAREVVATTHGDGRGRFTFERVAAGAWRLAPAPRGQKGSDASAHVACRLVIEPDQIEAEVWLESEVVERSAPR